MTFAKKMAGFLLQAKLSNAVTEECYHLKKTNFDI